MDLTATPVSTISANPALLSQLQSWQAINGIVIIVLSLILVIYFFLVGGRIANRDEWITKTYRFGVILLIVSWIALFIISLFYTFMPQYQAQLFAVFAIFFMGGVVGAIYVISLGKMREGKVLEAILMLFFGVLTIGIWPFVTAFRSVKKALTTGSYPYHTNANPCSKNIKIGLILIIVGIATFYFGIGIILLLIGIYLVISSLIRMGKINMALLIFVCWVALVLLKPVALVVAIVYAVKYRRQIAQKEAYIKDGNYEGILEMSEAELASRA